MNTTLSPFKYLITVLILTIVGCNNEEDSTFDYFSIWNCHNESAWDYETTRENVLGNWQWEYIQCCGDVAGVSDNSTEFIGLTVLFLEDGTGMLTEDGENSDFNWDLIQKDGELFGFATDPLITQLHGRLLFCNDIMMCNGSYIDGADNYYKKTK